MTPIPWVRLGALVVSLCALLALPLFAQATGDPPAPDANAVLAAALSIYGNLTNGAVLVGLLGLVNLLTNLTKVPQLEGAVPAKARPFIALGLGVTVALLGAKVTGADWTSAIVVGITAGLGSVAFHEIVQALKGTTPPGSGAAAALLAVVFLASSGCAWFKTSFARDELKCGEAALANATQLLLPTVISILEGGQANWAAQLSQLEATAGSAVVCAVQVAVADFGADTPDAGPPAPSTGPALSAAARRRAEADEPMGASLSAEPPRPKPSLSPPAADRARQYLKRR